MTIIGTFTKHDDSYVGNVHTLTFNVKVKILPVAKEAEKAPDYRVVAGELEIGAAWKRQTSGQKDYLSVKLDDPTFAAPVNARLIDGDGGNAILHWTRRADA